MPRYRFTGDTPEVFPSLVRTDDDGVTTTVACEPGDLVDLAEPVDHPRLALVEDAPATVVPDVVVVDDPRDTPEES